MEKIYLPELIEADILQKIQDGFLKYTGMAVLITDENGVLVTKGGNSADYFQNMQDHTKQGKKSYESYIRTGILKARQNGKGRLYRCQEGPVNYVAPILVKEKIIGCLAGGRIQDAKDAWEESRGADFLFAIAQLLSKVAARNYAILLESRKTERAARSQSDFVMNLSLHMKKNMEEWMECAKELMEQVDSHVAENLKKLLRQGTEVYSMMEDAVDYIRMSEGRVELSESNYRIRLLLSETVEGVRRHFGDQEINIDIQVDENVPEFMLGDAGRIGQIVNKLLVNNISNAEGGKVIVQASCQKVSYAAMLVLSIEDSSLELTQQQLKAIQDHMENGGAQTIEREEGVKLGLSFVSLLVRQMSGKIRVASKHKQGTVFTMILPQLEVKEGTVYGV